MKRRYIHSLNSPLHKVFIMSISTLGFLGAQTVKNLTAMQTCVQSLGQEDPLEKGKTAHSSIFAWRIPHTKKHVRLQSMGLQRIRHDWVNTFTLHFHLNFAVVQIQKPTLKIITLPLLILLYLPITEGTTLSSLKYSQYEFIKLQPVSGVYLLY